MINFSILRPIGALMAILVVSGCVTDPLLNAGLSIGPNGVTVQPSVQANVGGGLLVYTPQAN